MRKILWVSAVIVASLLFGGAIIGTIGYFSLLRMSPISIKKLTAAAQPTVVYDANGNVYEKIGTQETDLKYAQIPQDLQNALVATEDHTFWTGSSVDLRSILRSVFVDLVTRSANQGASTIEEQLAKIVFLNDNKTLSYKLEQIGMGIHIDQDFTKQEILTMYLNKVFLGENTVGVQQAALRYFGIDLSQPGTTLTLDQAALLAGLPQAPSAYDPLQHPAAALKRRNEVLANMAKYGYITEQAATKAEAAPLGVKYHALPTDSWNDHPLFTNVLFDYARRNGISNQQLLQGGLKVYTTVEPNVQQAVNDVFWSGQYDSDFPGPVDGAAVFVNPQTGGIAGAAGSRKTDYAPLGLDRIYSDSSPGSSIKPIMEYAPAIQSGNWGPTSILDNQLQDFGGGYEPTNWEGVDGPAKVTLQYALEESQNIASVWLLQQIGLSTGTSFAMNDGIQLTKQDREHLGVAIGGMQYGVNPLEMAQAYEAFDNNGVQMKVHLINKVVNQNGQTIYQFQAQSKTIMSAQTAAIMTNLMQDVVNDGTGTSAQVPGWGVAGKTGTVQYDTGLTGSEPNWIRDAWFDGYTPNLVGSIHIGYDVSSPADHMTMSPLDPSANAAMIFRDVVRIAESGIAPEQFNESALTGTQGTSTTGTNGGTTNTANSTNGSKNSTQTTTNSTATGNAANDTANNTANSAENTSNVTNNAANTSAIGNSTDNVPTNNAVSANTGGNDIENSTTNGVGNTSNATNNTVSTTNNAQGSNTVGNNEANTSGNDTTNSIITLNNTNTTTNGTANPVVASPSDGNGSTTAGESGPGASVTNNGVDAHDSGNGVVNGGKSAIPANTSGTNVATGDQSATPGTP